NDTLQLYNGISGYIKYYNEELRQRNLENQTPMTIYAKAA
ncbi:MAG: hypothetical protein ACJA01_003288, partial [Saprospiraceae bacterium]